MTASISILCILVLLFWWMWVVARSNWDNAEARCKCYEKQAVGRENRIKELLELIDWLNADRKERIRFKVQQSLSQEQAAHEMYRQIDLLELSNYALLKKVDRLKKRSFKKK